MGDPAGIGPEIVLKALADRSVSEGRKIFIIGDAKLLSATAGSLGIDIASIDVDLVDLANVSDDVRTGAESAETGKASAEYIQAAVQMWRNGEISAIVTAPISKSALSAAGYDFPGHTEFLAALTATKRFAMSFFAEKLRVVLLSTHVSLRDAIGLVNRDSLAELIRFSERELSALIGRQAHLAVAGLNPHASEGGLFGNEERDEIIPAINSCIASGIDVSGPFSPDTIFLRGFKGEFDGVIACYHDQATIAVKSLSFGNSVNVTLGLPVIRTSVDHGTAFDIAGKGIADESSMKAAIKLAAELAEGVRYHVEPVQSVHR